MQTPTSVELGTLPGLFMFVAWQDERLRYLLVQGEDEEDAKEVLETYLASQDGKWTIGAAEKAQVVKRGS